MSFIAKILRVLKIIIFEYEMSFRVEGGQKSAKNVSRIFWMAPMDCHETGPKIK